MTDTIYAVATGRGPAGIAVIRMSGPQSRDALVALTGKPAVPRRAVLRRLHTPEGGLIDEALCLWLPGPDSFTGEDGVEFHCHGAASVTTLMLETLARVEGCRLASAGEFTRRAFLNGRMDLAAVEGLADLIDSETEHQRQQALRQMMGGLSREIDQWRLDLLHILALFEADLDFSDEGDVDGEVSRRARFGLEALRDTMSLVLAQGDRGERVREGLTVLLAGPPNSGKSTLLNGLARRDVAIVSPVAGTTRDIVEARLNLDGYAVTVLDTAGLRETDDLVEREGVRRMLARATSADVVLWLNSVELPPVSPPEALVRSGVTLISVLTHMDRAPEGTVVGSNLAVSAVTGLGIDSLVQRIAAFASAEVGTAEEGAVLTRARHREAVAEALAGIDRALAILHSTQTELVAEEVRLAMRAIGRITGNVGAEQVLDQVFSHFCIGK